MQTTITKKFSGTPFSIECSQVENRPGTWNSTKVSIFRDDLSIGEYIRNYSSGADKTFYPFLQDGEWFALYSAEYTALRVMKLHISTIEDWCGNIPSIGGFCPTEVYIPKYNTFKNSINRGTEIVEYDFVLTDDSTEPSEEADFLDQVNHSGYQHTTYCNFGFLSGCVWGDDTSWKIRYIDLSKIQDKELVIIEKFGYWQIPNSLKLKECVDMTNWEPDHQWIQLTKFESINLETDQKI